MRTTLKYIISLAVALLIMVVFRAVGLTIYIIDGPGLEPTFLAGDHVIVNRWSYGLRVGGGNNEFFGYGRLLRQPMQKGDLVAFEHPTDGGIIICKCKGLPGEILNVNGETLVVPGLINCADADYYWMEAIATGNSTDSQELGFISEEYIIGRVSAVAYSHDPASSLWEGWRTDRIFMSVAQ